MSQLKHLQIACRFLPLLLLSCILSLASYGQLPQQQDSLEVYIDAILSPYSGANQPGATVAIIKDGKIVFKKGYGMADLKRRKANGPNISYKIASVSKQFTAAAIATLVQDGKLSLSDDVRKYVPDFPDYGKLITIYHLLYHTSGIRDYMVLMWLTGKSFEDNFTNADALAMIYRQKELNFVPGHRCVYSNSNYILLAAVVENVTGKNLALYARETLFKRLGMQHSGFENPHSAPKAEQALSYYITPGGYTAFENRFKAIGDGNMHTTIDDLAKWDQCFYSSDPIIAQLLTRGKLENGNNLTYGMGIMTGAYKNENIQMHPGAFLGYRSELLRFPDKRVSVICLANNEEINPELLTRAIADVYLFGTLPVPVSSTKLPQDHLAYLGKYEVAPNIFIDIRKEKNQLVGQVTGQPKQVLYTDSAATSFQIGTTSDIVAFHDLVNDRYQSLTVKQSKGNTTARRTPVVSPSGYKNFTGVYHNGEQAASYTIFQDNDQLWLKVGSNPAIAIELLSNYNKTYMNYRNLEEATIDFKLATDGTAEYLTVNSGRVKGLTFIKEKKPAQIN